MVGLFQFQGFHLQVGWKIIPWSRLKSLLEKRTDKQCRQAYQMKFPKLSRERKIYPGVFSASTNWKTAISHNGGFSSPSFRPTPEIHRPTSWFRPAPVCICSNRSALRLSMLMVMRSTKLFTRGARAEKSCQRSWGVFPVQIIVKRLWTDPCRRMINQEHNYVESTAFYTHHIYHKPSANKEREPYCVRKLRRRWNNGDTLRNRKSTVHHILRWCGSQKCRYPLLSLNGAKFWNMQKRSYWFASFEMMHTLIALISPVSPPYPCWQVWEVKFAPVQRYSRRLRMLLYQALEMSKASLPSAKRLDQAPGKHGDFWVTWSMVGFLRPCLPGWW